MDCVLEQDTNGGVSSSTADDSFVDQLLNLNPENTLDDVDHHHTAASFISPLPQPPSPAGDFDSLLTLPEEESDLEWLSHFVEDSFSEFCHATHTAAQAAVLPRSRRSKRLRPSSVRSWTISSLTETTTSSSPSSSATSSPYGPTSPSTPLALAFPDPNSKKKKKGRGGSGSAPTTSRRCSHCGTHKTPQWRAGPMGSKTLCNACGVRFKTGRLFPEYRPACSPTFSSVMHSNSHRKVLEMRRSKEIVNPAEPGLTQVT